MNEKFQKGNADYMSYKFCVLTKYTLECNEDIN